MKNILAVHKVVGRHIETAFFWGGPFVPTEGVYANFALEEGNLRNSSEFPMILTRYHPHSTDNKLVIMVLQWYILKELFYCLNMTQLENNFAGNNFGRSAALLTKLFITDSINMIMLGQYDCMLWLVSNERMLLSKYLPLPWPYMILVTNWSKPENKK